MKAQAHVARSVAALAGAALGWAWFEAGWVRLETLDVELPRLAPELEGLRIAHLSDLHLGMPSRSKHAVAQAVDWVEERQPDLTLLTGDLLTRASGEPTLRRILPRLPRAYAILGNHDLAISRDPFVERTFVQDLSPVRLL